MATLSTVVLDAPAHGPFLVHWPQPYREGDDTLDWYVTTGSTTRRVQRDRLTDEVHLCHVLVDAGTTGFSVETGVATSPSPAWTAPTLTGLKLRFHGQDGSVLEALLDGTDVANVDTTRRDGTWCRQIKRWTHARITSVGSGNGAIGDQVLGVHAYLKYRADFAGVVDLDVVISNASGTVANQGNGLGADWYGHVYLSGAELVLPAGWNVVAERPMPAPGSPDHVFPCKLGTVRRYVLHAAAEANGATKAADVLALRGLGRAVSGASYRTIPSYLGEKTLLPDLDLAAFQASSLVGYAAARAAFGANYAQLVAAVQSGGTSSAHYLNSPRLGFFHPLGEIDPQAPGGSDIACLAGLGQVREAMQYERLRGDLRWDGCGIRLYNRATGEPLRTRDFGAAYTVPGSIPSYDSNPAYLGYQPFTFYIQNNGGYECPTLDTSHFNRWWPPVWPPHFRDNRSQLPDGSGNPSFDKFVPSDPSLWGAPPHTLNAGTCSYQNSLISRWVPHPTFTTGNWFSNVQLGHRDPEDGQHVTRMILDRKAVAYQTGDLVSIDDLDMCAEWCGLAWSEAGHVPYLYFAPYNFRSLVWKEAVVNASPHTAAVYCGRESAWVGETFALQFALSAPARRDDGYPRYGIRRRAEAMHTVLRKSTMPNGVTGRVQYPGSGAGQLSEAWITPGPGSVYTGPPIPANFDIFQVGLETPLVGHALFALAKQLGKVEETRAQLLQMARSHTRRTDLYVSYYANPGEFGPPKYFGCWDTNTNAPTTGSSGPRAFGGTGNPGSPNHGVLVEIGFRLTGNLEWFGVANALGFPNPSATPAQRAQQLINGTTAFNMGLIAYLLGQAGADDTGVDPPATINLSAAFTVAATFAAQLVVTIVTDPDDPDDDDDDDDDGGGDDGGGTGGDGGDSGGGTGGGDSSFAFEYDADGDSDGDNVLLTWTAAGGDVRVINGDLQRDAGLASAVLISLFSDARAPVDRTRAIEEQDLRGWWGEAEGDRFGSLLWTLDRETQSAETLARAREYSSAALAWMLAEDIARQIDVEASFVGRTGLLIRVTIARGSSRRWARLWRGALNVTLRIAGVTLQVDGA